ncbi:MAG: oligosaccharide flippase family protein [Chloroflexi bacterium]|nr:oligosaccharide flippase family protein [Chloroflexota bacterium]
MFRLPLERLEQLYLRVFDTELLRRILRNSSYLVSATVLSAGMGMVQGAIQVRVVGVASVGLLAALVTFTNVLNRFTSFRIDELVVRYVRLYEERKQHERAAAVYKIAALLELGGNALAFLLILLLAPLGVELFSDQGGVEYLFILYGSLVLINVFFDSSDGILQVFNRFGAKSVIDITQSVIRLGLTVLVWLTGGGMTEIILAELAGRLVRSAAVLAVALSTARKQWGAGWWRTPFSVLKEDRRSLLTFAFSTNLSATVSLVAKDSEDLWANAFLGNLVGGYYAVARALIGFLQIPVSPLPSTTYPELSRAVAKDDWKSVRHVLRRGSMLAALYSLPVAAFLILFGPQVITLYTKQDLPEVYAPLLVLLMGYSVVNIFYWSRAALLAFNRPVFPTIVNTIGMVLKVVGIFIFAPLGAVAFAALLAGYYVFTVGIAVIRILQDVRAHLASSA